MEQWLLKQAGWIRGPAAEKLAEHLVYIRNNKDRTTEGAAKSVVNKRCKGSGQRWGEHGLRAALSLRSWYCSDRFPLAWPHLSRHFAAEVVNQ